MLNRLKIIVRNLLPARLQVPLRQLYSRVRGYSESEMALLPFLVRDGARVADIGANRGQYAHRLWKLGAQVEMFEPNPHCSALLVAWAEGKPRLAVHSVALSSGHGIAELHVPVDSHGIEHDASASLGGGLAGNCREIEVELRTLDSFDFADLEFVKIDAEGHEDSVIGGAKITLGTSRPAILVEIEQRHHPVRPILEIFDEIERLGYAGFFLADGTLLPIADFRVDLDQAADAFTDGRHPYRNNFLFLARDRLAAGEYVALAARWMKR